jgi:hypothetical protein
MACARPVPNQRSSPSHRGHLSWSRPLRAVLCLLAVLIQVVTPVVHTWEVTAPQMVLAVTAPAVSWSREGSPSPAALTLPTPSPPRLPHDAALCPVCQFLTRSRDWMTARVNAVGLVTLLCGLVCFLCFLPANVLRYAVAARAPPSSC